MKNCTAFLLATILLLSSVAFTACGDRPGPTQDASSVSAVSEPLPPEESSSPDPEPASDGGSEDRNDKPEKYGAVVDDGVLKYRLVNGSFYEVYGLYDEAVQDLEIPGKVGGKPVKRIRGFSPDGDIMDPETYQGAFQGSGIRSVKIAEGVTSIGYGAFMGCVSLEEVFLPASLVSFDDLLLEEDVVLFSVPFNGCTSLRRIEVAEGSTAYCAVDGVLFTADMQALIAYPVAKEGNSYVVPDGVKVLAEVSFYANTNLTTVTLPESLETIAARAFSSCAALERISIPGNVREIGEFAFLYCNALTAIDVDSSNGAYKSVDGVLFDGDGERLIQYPISSPRSEYVIPEGVKKVDNYALCGGLLVDFEQGEITTPGSLKKLTLPKSLEEIAELSFHDSLEEFAVADGCKAYSAVDGILYDGSGETLLKYPDAKKDERLILPEGVKKIREGAFGSEILLKAVTMPAGVEDICGGYGVSWRRLEEITVAEGCKNYRTAGGVLYDGSGETMLQYPVAKQDPAYTVPEGVKTISRSAGLMGNAYLKKISLPASIDRIEAGFRPFVAYSAEKYHERMFHDALEEIEVAPGGEHFSAADGLLLDSDGSTLLCYPVSKPGREVTLPEGIETIEKDAIWSPLHLTTLRLPESLRTVRSAGIWSDVLEALYIPAGVETIASGGILATRDTKIYCAAPEQPKGWEQSWAYYPHDEVDADDLDSGAFVSTDITPLWNHTGE